MDNRIAFYIFDATLCNHLNMPAKTAPSPDTVFRRYPKTTLSIFVLLISFLLDFIAAKIFIADYSFRIKHSYYSHSLKPNVRARDVFGPFKYKIRTNSMGFKDYKPRTVQLKKVRPRVLFMGDSFTEGIGVPFEKTFVAAIQKAYPDMEILNAGVASYSPVIYYYKTKYLLEVKKLEIDHLIVMIDLTDIQDEVAYEGYQPSEEFSWKFRLKESIINHLRYKTVFGSVFFNWYTNRWRADYEKRRNDLATSSQQPAVPEGKRWPGIDTWTYDEEAYELWGKKGINLARHNIDKLYQLVRRHGVKLSIAVYPYLRQIEQGDINCRQVKIWEEFCQERDIQFINFFPDWIYIDNPAQYFFVGDDHWNEKGHQKIAKGFISGNYIQE